jgi:hypothetical protein
MKNNSSSVRSGIIRKRDGYVVPTGLGILTESFYKDFAPDGAFHFRPIPQRRTVIVPRFHEPTLEM